jgi:hypothetical protein
MPGIRGALTAALVAALLGAGAADASAARLNNGGSPLSITIPNGTTFAMQNTTSLVYTGGPMTDSCAFGDLQGTVLDNGASGSPIRLSLTTATHSSCTYPTVPYTTPPWVISIAQDGAPWDGTGNMRVIVTYAGTSCSYRANATAALWRNGTSLIPSQLDFAGGTLSTLNLPCPSASVSVSGEYILTRVDYMLSPRTMVIG